MSLVDCHQRKTALAGSADAKGERRCVKAEMALFRWEMLLFS
jgi:hypothetical protein